MAKKISGYIRITVGAGKANPAPPVGSALGQHGVNIMEFCKAFNADTQSMDSGIPVPVLITVYVDKSFSYVLKSPAASYFLKKYAKVDKGSSSTKKSAFVGKVTRSDCAKIAEIKMDGLNANDIDAATKIIVGTAESMGLEVVDG